MKFVVFLSLLLLHAPVYARKRIAFAPLPVTADTVGLWNFDSDSGNNVVDSADNPLTGTAFNTVYGPMPDLDPSFSNARKFVTNSFVDLGVAPGSKLDFTGQSEVTIEAMVRLTDTPTSNHTVVSLDNVRLMLVNNHPAAFIRQTGGVLGVVGDTALQLNTNYSLALSYVNNRLSIIVNGRTDGQVILSENIGTFTLSSSHAFIGGDLFNKFFPGYIDDVRIQNRNTFDVDAPELTLVSPTSFIVNTAFPTFVINFADVGSGVDVNTVHVYLNGVQQVVNFNQTGINGHLNDALRAGQINEVKVVLSDNAGNQTIKTFNFSFTNILAKTEYENDANTIALWHMNDFSSALMLDSSSNGRHGYADPTQVGTGDGVFGAGKTFLGTNASSFSLTSTLIPGQQFTLETWVRPAANYSGEEIIFSNGQVKISRFSGGFVRITFFTTHYGEVFESANSILPVGDLHHFAVSWDGNNETNNLNLYIDGAIIQTFNAPTNCDFNPLPQTGIIGQFFTGTMDEMRFSSIVRTGFNIPTFDNSVISYLSPLQGSSVSVINPVIHVGLNSLNLDPGNAVLRLNGVRQFPSSNLVFTSTSIDGLMANLVTQGLNTLEVDLIDANNVQRKKSEYFFYVKDNGGAVYTPDQYTIGLWHLDNQVGTKLLDSTSNHLDLLVNNSTSVPGVIGSGRRNTVSLTNNSVTLKSRAFTIEGLFRIDPTAANSNSMGNLWSLTGPEFSLYGYLNPFNGSIKVEFTTPDQSISQTVSAAFPMDGEYHHVAFTHDPARGFAQALLVVDGKVKQAFNVRMTCDCVDNLNLSFGYSTWFHTDEARLSKIARYNYNIGDLSGNRPIITQIAPLPGSTSSISSTNVNFSFSDSDSISLTGTKLLVNGVEAQGLNLDLNGTNASLTGSVNLNPGSNLLEAHVRDSQGNEQVTYSYVFYIAKEAPAPYSTDANTVVLYHMEETSGTVMTDDSGNGHHLNLNASWVQNVPGVFSTNGARVNSTSDSTQITGLTGLGTYTAETWFKPTTNNYIDVLRVGGVNLRMANGQFYVDLPGGSSYSTAEVVITDSNFHHIAFIVDKNNPYHNILLVVDGQVKGNFSVDATKLLMSSDSTAYIYGTCYNNDLDEFRFSKVARYSFNWSQSSKKNKRTKK